MPKDPPPAFVAAADQLEAAVMDLHDYIHGLDHPDLLAELRCTIGRLTQYAARTDGPLSPLGLNLSVLAEGLSRFDLAGALCEDGELDKGHRPVPGAVKASTDCACDEPHGGARGRVNAIHQLGHTAADRFRA